MPFAPTTMVLESTAFEHLAPIPDRLRSAGENHSTALSRRNAPDNTRRFAVFCHDRDAPLVSANGTYGFVHWVLNNISGSVHQVPEAISEYTQGEKDTGGAGYCGPNPSEGNGEHRYSFWLVALDSDLNLPAGLTLWQFLEKEEPHIKGTNRLVGTNTPK